MKKKISVAFIAFALLLTGCSAIDSGVITKKKHSDAYTYPVTYCAMYNKDMICQMYAQRYDYVPPSWSFNLKKDDKEGFVYVSESTWNSYDVGDYYGEN